MSKIRFIGLDVHADTIAVAVAEPNQEVRGLGVIPNRFESIRKLVHKLGGAKDLRVCYEAGPTAYVLYWQQTALGVACQVVAPTLVPTKAGDRVKTDRRDAEKLARCYRAGDLTPVWVPDPAHEAIRDLVRTREDAKQDQQRARQRLGKFLLRHGWRPPEDIKKNWTNKHMDWVKRQVRCEQPALQAAFLDYVHEIEHAADRLERLEKAIDDALAVAPAEIQEVVQALQALRGVAKIAAVSIVAELGDEARDGSAFFLDLAAGTLRSPSGRVVALEIPTFRREQLLTGADEIALTLQRKPEIAAYQERECAAHPWVYLPQRQNC